MNPFDYKEPDTLEEVFSLLEQYGEDCKIVAGGTALIIMLSQRLLAPACLVSLRRLSGLRGLSWEEGVLQLGALLTHREVEVSTEVTERLPVLAETYAKVATIRVRNMATVGGSLAHADPNQDSPVTLLALDARVKVASSSGSREVPISDFFTDYYETVLEPQEVVTEVLVPEPSPGSGTVYLKYLPRTAEDYATGGVAATIVLDPASGLCSDCRIGLGSVASVPLRAGEAEDLLRGQTLSSDVFDEAGAAARKCTDSTSDVRGSDSYKEAMTEVFVKRALTQAWERARSG
jgi:carbon-monoxide dehydrogenase medium subunit